MRDQDYVLTATRRVGHTRRVAVGEPVHVVVGRSRMVGSVIFSSEMVCDDRRFTHVMLVVRVPMITLHHPGLSSRDRSAILAS